MFSFRLKTLENCIADNDALALLEISTLFQKRVGLDEIAIDRDAALGLYISSITDPEERSAFEDEPQAAEDEMLEGFEADLLVLIEERQRALGAHYPFAIDNYRKLELRDEAVITGVGAAYLSLQAYRALNAGLIEIEEADERLRKQKQRAFNVWFPAMFEVIAGYAVAGRSAGVPHLISDCRSSQRLNALLNALCARLASGQVKKYDDWDDEQKASNDGGVDCIVHVGGPGMPGDAYLLLVGATIQSSDLINKIIDDVKRDRFGRYFAKAPGALAGVLVQPHDETILMRGKCRARHCQLFSYEQIWKNIGKRPDHVTHRRYFGSLDRKARKYTKRLNGAVFIAEYEHHSLNV